MLRLLQTYGFSDWKQLSLSLFPSFKYDNQGMAFGLSAVVGIVAEILGFSPLIVLVMLVAIVVETSTGIYASKIMKVPFESWRFSRCVLKLCIWMALFFIVHSFAQEMSLYPSWPYILGAWVFAAMHVILMAYFVVEYVTSIMENTAVIDGKPKDTYINAMKGCWDAMVERITDTIRTRKDK